MIALPVTADATAPTDARADILATYNFDPSKLPYEEQVAKASVIEAIWKRYDASPASYHSALRGLLTSKGLPEILYCDGAIRLIAKSQPAEDISPYVQLLGACSLAEIEQTPYFYTVHSLAVRGMDTFDLQVRMLSKPKYSAFIVAHALELGQDFAFLYPFLVQDESRYVSRLVERARIERDPTASVSLLRALWYAATPEAEAALRSIAAQSSDEAKSTEARKLLERIRQFVPLSQMTNPSSTLNRSFPLYRRLPMRKFAPRDGSVCAPLVMKPSTTWRPIPLLFTGVATQVAPRHIWFLYAPALQPSPQHREAGPLWVGVVGEKAGNGALSARWTAGAG